MIAKYDMLAPNRKEGDQRMNEPIQELADEEIAIIERLIRIFKEKFIAGTLDANNFISISQIELLWSELQNGTNNIYSDMIRKMMSEVDESDLIRKKKDITCSKE
jgi:hypothetical protein